jgi:carboxypeptidase C (cathepsin A)
MIILSLNELNLCPLIFAGHYVPQLAQLIYEKNRGIQNPIINFKGFMVNLYVHALFEAFFLLQI